MSGGKVDEQEAQGQLMQPKHGPSWMVRSAGRGPLCAQCNCWILTVWDGERRGGEGKDWSKRERGGGGCLCTDRKGRGLSAGIPEYMAGKKRPTG